jgi:hypothetical protein
MSEQHFLETVLYHGVVVAINKNQPKTKVLFEQISMSQSYGNVSTHENLSRQIVDVKQTSTF